MKWGRDYVRVARAPEWSEGGECYPVDIGGSVVIFIIGVRPSDGDDGDGKGALRNVRAAWRDGWWGTVVWVRGTYARLKWASRCRCCERETSQ